MTELLVTSVLLLVVLRIASQIVVESDRVYGAQQQYLDARGNSAAALDVIVRLMRQAQTIAPDPDGNGVLDSIRIVADWNPRDGDTGDPYEDITFTAANGVLWKFEPTDAAPVAFADRIAAITFSYLTPAGSVLPNPSVVPQAQLGVVNLTVRTTSVDNRPGLVLTSSASLRRSE